GGDGARQRLPLLRDANRCRVQAPRLAIRLSARPRNGAEPFRESRVWLADRAAYCAPSAGRSGPRKSATRSAAPGGAPRPVNPRVDLPGGVHLVPVELGGCASSLP